MWYKKFKIEYTDGKVIESSTKDWENIRADGVYLIDFNNAILSGDSVYYLYSKEVPNLNNELFWVVGSFSSYHDRFTEFLMRENNEVIGIERRSMPDLKHSQVKLGWWKEN